MEIWSNKTREYLILKENAPKGASMLYRRYIHVTAIPEALKQEGKIKVAEFNEDSANWDVYIDEEKPFDHSISFIKDSISVIFTPIERAFLGKYIFDAFDMIKIVEWKDEA